MWSHRGISGSAWRSQVHAHRWPTAALPISLCLLGRTTQAQQLAPGAGFAGAIEGSAILIHDARPVPAIPLTDLDPDLTAPQSMCYLKDAAAELLMERVGDR